MFVVIFKNNAGMEIESVSCATIHSVKNTILNMQHRYNVRLSPPDQPGVFPCNGRGGSKGLIIVRIDKLTMLNQIKELKQIFFDE